MDILRTNEDKLHIVAKELMVKEKINGERFKQLMSPDYNPDEEIEIIETPAPVAQQEETAETPVENTVVADVVETVRETTETSRENN